MSTTLATLAVVVDTTKVKTGTVDINNLVPAAKGAQAAITALTAATAPAGAAISTMATATKSAASAHSSLSSQSQAAMHSMRSFLDATVAGISPVRALAMEAGRLSFAASGPGGLSGAFSEASSMFTKFLTPAALVTGGLAAVGVASALVVNSIANSELAFGALADRAGIAVTSLHTLQSAASFKGISLDDFTKAMTSFAAQTTEATHNAGTLGELLRVNGDAAGTLEQNFSKVADLIKNASSDAERYRLITQAGLPATREWVELLKGGSTGIAAARAEAAQFAQAADDSLIKRARDFDEAWSHGWTNFVQGAKSAAVSAIDALSHVVDQARYGLRELTGVSGNVVLGAAFRGEISGTKTSASSNINDFYDATGAGKAGAAPKTTNPDDIKRTIALQQQLTGILGAQASIDDQVRTKENEITLARIAGVKITDQQAASVLNYTAANALGLIAIREQTAQQQIAIATLGMSVGAASAYSSVQEKINEARIKGAPLQADQIAQLRTEAKALGDATQAAAELKARFDLSFNTAQLGRSDQESQVASALKQLGLDYESNQSSLIANQVRFNDTLTQTKSTAQDALGGLAKDLLAGRSAADALQNALSKVENKLVDIISNAAISSFLRTLAGAAGGGGVTPGNDPFGSAGLFSTHHGGGVVGSESGPSRALPLSTFIGAPRFHGGGLVGGERAIIAKDGETVLTPGQLRGLAPAGQSAPAPAPVINIHNHSGGQVTTTKRKDGNGASVTDVIIGVVSHGMANGMFDGPLRARTGQAVQPRGR